MAEHGWHEDVALLRVGMGFTPDDGEFYAETEAALASLVELIQAQARALQHHGYGAGLCRCEYCALLGSEYVDALASNQEREPE